MYDEYGEGTLQRPPIIYWSQRLRRHHQCTTRSSSEIEAWSQVWAPVGLKHIASCL